MKQVLKVVISAARIWVGLSSTDVAENTQEIFGWVSSAVKTYLGYLCFVFNQKWTRHLNETTVSSSV